MSEQELDYIAQKIAGILAGVMPSDNMDSHQAARYLGIQMRTLRGMVANAEIPHYKIGRKLLFKRTELDEWLIDYRVHTGSEIGQAVATYCAVKPSPMDYLPPRGERFSRQK